jgi:Spy/CpxP family protein refolding chaperone
MKRQPLVSVCGVALVMVAVVMVGSLSAQAKWWTSERVITLLGLTEEQADEIERIFQTSIQPQREAWKELERLEKDFSDLLRRDSATEEDVMTAIDELEAARATLGKLRALMLYRQRQVLTPEQRATYEADRRRAERDRPRDGSGNRGPSERRPPRSQ